MSHQTIQQYQLNLANLVGNLVPHTASGSNYNGYANIVFAGNNYILQFGYQQVGSNNIPPDNVMVSFPISFPTHFVSAICATKRSNGGAQGSNYIVNSSLSAMNVNFDALDNQYQIAVGGYWIAIGY